MSLKNWFFLFETHWPVSLTMVFGSFIGGATAEGGGAVAFPVFTKVLHIQSTVARDFAFAIQSVGMTCGSILICRAGYKFLPDIFIWTFFGAAVSTILGLNFLAPFVFPPYPKILFSLFTLSFGGFLLWMNRGVRTIRTDLSCDTWQRKSEFFLVGIIGGLITCLIGVGADVVLFVVLCLRYDVDEKIGTRTTIPLQAAVSMVAFSYLMISGKLSSGVLPMWICAIPIVAFGGPLGANFCSWQKRGHVVIFLISLILIEFITTLWLIPFDSSAKIFSVGFLFTSAIVMVFLRARKVIL
ncbi:MAG: sulfite exporter TauE/SafE family protein [Candidatus Riflebacteria bacterium]|nr:sulfite exporter TauE/SafE family protein [Candidatus Riflebacteria bacterium]